MSLRKKVKSVKDFLVQGLRHATGADLPKKAIRLDRTGRVISRAPQVGRVAKRGDLYKQALVEAIKARLRGK
jgi:hypothetical protein